MKRSFSVSRHYLGIYLKGQTKKRKLQTKWMVSRADAMQRSVYSRYHTNIYVTSKKLFWHKEYQI
jgi:hypothetical protein